MTFVTFSTQTIALPEANKQLHYIYTLQFVEVVNTVPVDRNTTTFLQICNAQRHEQFVECNEDAKYYELPMVNGILPQSAHLQ